MFYSHTFLARKGPLGTVWCAAHLQHRLRKTHYVTTNVPTTVEKIMNPEVPIALRMSGHLLLGVVRIYSKQVDYFYEDCNDIWITVNRVFTAVTVNLPSDGTQAPFHSVTLPEKCNLDAMELDDYNINWREDSHLKSLDEITLTEQIPTGKDPYIVISFDEHDLRASSSVEDASGSGPVPMEEDDHPPGDLDASATCFKSPSTINNLGADGNMSSQNIPSIEIMRKARDGFDSNNSPILSDRAEPDKFLEEQINRDMEMHTPAREVADAHFSSSHNHDEQHTPGQHLNSEIPFDHHSPLLELQPTPEMEIQPTPVLEIQPSPRMAKPKVKRKRRQAFDPEIVLTAEYIKNALADTSDILRVRGNCPLTSLSIWKRNNKRRLENDSFIAEPSVTGYCADLQDIYREDCAKNHPVAIQETREEINVAHPSLSAHDSNIEIEVPRNKDPAPPEDFVPSFSTPVPSPSGRSHFVPESSNFRLDSEHMETTGGNRTLPTSDVGASGNLDSEMRTPYNDIEFDNTVLSDIAEMVPSAGDLEFLEQDDNSPPAGSQGTPATGIFPGNQNTPELQALSSRTRAVAQYLKKQSVTPISGYSVEPSEDLSMGKILEDKPRKISARMFYETLVLSNHGLVDVRQEKPYADIILRVTPKLSKEQFSGC